MRLIDGDALIELINGGYDLDFDEVPETKRELLRMIMDQPTVDAVPLKWIIRRIDGLNIQAENSTDDNKWADFAREAFALEKIVKFWAERKEK